MGSQWTDDHDSLPIAARRHRQVTLADGLTPKRPSPTAQPSERDLSFEDDEPDDFDDYGADREIDDDFIRTYNDSIPQEDNP